MNAIAPGTPCYLVNLRKIPVCNGRVVEIVGPAPAAKGDPDYYWYEYVSAWSIELFGGRQTVAPRRNLRPITPPEIAPAAARTRALEEATR